MTREEIDIMWQQALQDSVLDGEVFTRYHFAKMVATKERERYMQLFLDPENQPTQFGTATQEYRDQEILEEREACAKLCEDSVEYAGDELARQIRARA